jgi:glutamyl-tRNA synthetase
VQLWDFARINFIRTFLSKRKLTKVVESGKVTGWDDPRMPTVRGILRRGLTVTALREFMLKQGPSRSQVLMDWTILWSMNNKVLDPVAPRHTAVDKNKVVTANIMGGPEIPYTDDNPKHPKNPAIGTKAVTYSSTILIEQSDAATFFLGEEITLMAWGNAIGGKLEKAADGTVSELRLELPLDGDFRKTEKKITWLSAVGSDLISAELWELTTSSPRTALGRMTVPTTISLR